MRLLLPPDSDYEAAIDTIVRRASKIPPDIEAGARAIVDDVRARGDTALCEYTQRFEGRDPVEIPKERWDEQANTVSVDIANALRRAAERILAFHEQQRQPGYELDEDGVRLALRVEPLGRVGLYVPGGNARYPSSVLMTAIPARIAGVRELVMVTPGASPETLFAAREAGVDRVFEMGGAHAVAALAYGTQSIPRVDKIVGPGNAYVAAAKRIVFGDVDIDSVAGPSEILILADEQANPRFVAADLIAQAEHDTQAVPLLVTTSEPFAVRVRDEVTRQLADLPRRAIAAKALSDNGVAIVAIDLPAAIRIANRVAPEHLELHVRNAAHTAGHIRTAGAIFVGPYTPEAVGDYMAGPNHVLPTAGAARFASPLGVYDFVKRISVLEYSPEALRAQVADVSRLARVEGLVGHARSVAIRLEEV